MSENAELDSPFTLEEIRKVVFERIGTSPWVLKVNFYLSSRITGEGIRSWAGFRRVFQEVSV